MALQSKCGLGDLNAVEGSRNICTGDFEYGNYGYNITRWTAILFVVLFSLTLLAHLFQVFKYRPKYYFLLWTFGLGAFAELLGWIGRLWSSESQEWSPTLGGYWASNDNAFMMQICTLIIAPAFISGGEYVILARIIRNCGEKYSRLRSKTYAIIFVTGDVFSLVIQAAGGGIAASSKTDKGAENGADIMVAGVIIQLVVIVAYSILLLEFWWRAYTEKPVKQLKFKRNPSPILDRQTVSLRGSKHVQLLMATLVFSTLLVFIRSIYRTIELLNGWRGPIITDEKLFCILDGLMIVCRRQGRLLPESADANSHGMVSLEKSPKESAISSQRQDIAPLSA